MVFVFVAFAADTFTTAIGGVEAIRHDTNPLVNKLSFNEYLVISVVRLVAACALLTLFWPERLVLRKTLSGFSRICFRLFPYERILPVLVSVAVLVIATVKMFAVMNNLAVQYTEMSAAPGWLVAVSGILGGLILSHIILFLHYHIVGWYKEP